MDEIQQVGRDLIRGSQLLLKELNNVWGHVAVRIPSTDGRRGFMLKHLRVPPPPVDPQTIMVFDEDGELLEGERALPMEVPLYVHVFKARPDVQSVVHTHPLITTALSMAGKTLFAISNDTYQFGHGIPVFPGDLIHTSELGTAFAATLGSWPAALMKGHGATTVGPTIAHAVQTTLLLEQAAKQQIWAATLGTPEMLDDRVLEFQNNPPPGEGALALWYTKLIAHGLDDRSALKPTGPIYDVGDV